MNKLKAITASIISTFLLTNVITADVSASSIYIDRITQGGFEQYKDTLYFVKQLEVGGIYNVEGYYDFHYNIITVTITDSADWDNVYEKYLAELDFDMTESKGTTVYLWDEIDEGDDPLDPISIADKQEQIADVCAEMYRDGVIDFARYNTFTAYYDDYRVDNGLMLFTDIAETEFTELLNSYTTDYTLEVGTGKYIVSFGGTVNFEKLVDIQRSFYSEHGIGGGYQLADRDLSLHHTMTELIDLLAPIKEAESCDLNASGTPDLDDAVLLLSHYANTAAGIETAAETEAADYDVNGDGAVDLDDAVKILTVYAEMAAGLR